ncbi:potassium channel family protein [Thiofaba sp. EF100]|uniref:potassium channel family protein n=1 Tax=Thiofaba sp. EF100 TaxID=3121274 RepID=UPI003221D4EA
MKHIFADLPARLGVAGVSAHENERARRWGAWLEIVVSLATLWLPFAWYAEHKGVMAPDVLRMIDLCVWGLFVAEAFVLSLLVSNRLRYWQQNWLNLLIVFGGLPLLFMQQGVALAFLRVLRLVLLVVMVMRFARRSLRLLAQHALAATLTLAFFLVVTVGTLVASIDPAIPTFWDGMWWALVTVSTVGYGDVVPVSAEGRLLGVILILFGVATFSLVTANLAAFVLGLRLEETATDIEREEIKHELLILSRMEEMERRFDRLEAWLAAQVHPPVQQAVSDDAQSDAPNRP